MISTEKKFIFIHIPKTAGTSIRVALAPYTDGLNVKKRLANKISHRIFGRPIFSPIESPLKGHALALDYLNYLGNETFEDYFKFAFVRNPFDLHVSLYEYIRQTPHHKKHELVSRMSFLDYTFWRCNNEPQTQLDFICDKSKNLIVDFVGRFEHLERDFSEISIKLGINPRLRFLNSSNRSYWMDYYSSETSAVVRKTFRDDFDFFEYSY